MLGAYKFMRVTHGGMRFASVTVSSEPAETSAISLDALEERLRNHWKAPLEDGIRLALLRHEELGGPAASVSLQTLIYTIVDTTPDALTCAAGVATWKALGHLEAEASLQLVDGRWALSFLSGAG